MIRSVVPVIAGVAIVFFSAISSLNLEVKVGIAVGVLAALILFLLFSALGKRPVGEGTSADGLLPDGGGLDEELSILEEAAIFFSASIKQQEMLRLLETRLGSVLPGCSARIFRLTSEGVLDAPHLRRSEKMQELPARVALVSDTAAKTLNTKEVVRSGDFSRVDDLKSGLRVAAISLRRAEEVFCVLTVSCEAGSELPTDDTLKAVAERLAPLISGSVSFESSMANALKDSLTDLPNERAMYLVLENQVAEAQRFGSTRPLTVLAADIRSFEEINRRFGHAAGDRLLIYVGNTIKEQLRKMDLLARAADDEFIIVLPTAEKNSAGTVKARLEQAFAETKFVLPDGSDHQVRLSYGSASYGDDGETASEIVKLALERKQVGKSKEQGSVIEFPNKDRPPEA